MIRLVLILALSATGCTFFEDTDDVVVGQVQDVGFDTSLVIDAATDMPTDTGNNLNNTNNLNNVNNSSDAGPDLNPSVDMPRDLPVPVGLVCVADAEPMPDGSCDLMAQNDCPEVGICEIVVLLPPPNPSFGIACVQKVTETVLLDENDECSTSGTSEICAPDLVCNTLNDSPSRCRRMCELSTGRGCDPEGLNPHCAQASAAFASVGVGLCASSCDAFQ